MGEDGVEAGPEDSEDVRLPLSESRPLSLMVVEIESRTTGAVVDE